HDRCILINTPLTPDIPSLSFYLHPSPPLFFFFFFNDTATTEIYTLSLHDALPILSALFPAVVGVSVQVPATTVPVQFAVPSLTVDRKSTRLNSSHVAISYAVFCLKKKKKKK